MDRQENNECLTTQIITYIGNKRSLLGNIEKEILEIEKKIGKQKKICDICVFLLFCYVRSGRRLLFAGK